MDPCAELTLRLVRIAQEALEPSSSLVDWCILPGQQRATWREAADRLGKAAKPVLVAPILEPGCLAFWSVDGQTRDFRQQLERELSNQQTVLTARLDGLRLSVPCFVETPDAAFRVTLADFHRWAREYCLHSVGIGIQRSAADTARIVVRRPGGHRAPVGWIPPTV